MELKKSPKADLEKRKGLYFEIGLVVILGLCLVAFTVKSYDQGDKKASNQGDTEQVQDLDEIENTDIEEETPPPPPPEPEEQEVKMDEIIVKEDDEQLSHEADVVDAEEAQNTSAIADVPEEVEEIVEEEIVKVPDQMAEFPGGMEALLKYLAENIKYPELARANGITGKVYIRFVVEKDGSITDAKVVRDIGGGCGTEALRVVKSMPKWKPGKVNANAVRSEFNLPVSFNLRN